jgi:hypothetical protein
MVFIVLSWNSFLRGRVYPQIVVRGAYYSQDIAGRKIIIAQDFSVGFSRLWYCAKLELRSVNAG